MQNRSLLKDIIEISDDPGNKDLPLFMQKATHCMSKGLTANRYEKHKYIDMVKRCNHLDAAQQSTIMRLFSNSKEVFSGTLRRVLGSPVKLNLKKTAAPFFSRAYTLPKAFEKMAKYGWGGRSDPVDIGVLVKNV